MDDFPNVCSDFDFTELMPYVGAMQTCNWGVDIGALASKVQNSVMYFCHFKPVGVSSADMANGLPLGDVLLHSDQQTN